MQEILIILLFLTALGYMGWRAYRSFAQKKAGCGKGCGCADTPTVARHMLVNKSDS